MFHALLEPQLWVALATLTLLEIVLGIDNIIFISIITQKLKEPSRSHARRLGLAAAAITRILLLLVLIWIKHLTTPLLTIDGFAITGQTLVLVGGGLFLIGKSATEIHGAVEGDEETETKPAKAFFMIILQIMLLDIIFSLDSIITAIGLVDQIPVMIAAILIAIMVMIYLSGLITKILQDHPTIKMLALSFLLMIGLMLILEGFHIDVPKGYAYVAMAFAVLVELLNILARKKKKSAKG